MKLYPTLMQSLEVLVVLLPLQISLRQWMTQVLSVSTLLQVMPKFHFAADGSFKKEFLDKIQKDVNKANDQFVSHVSNHTGLSIQSIKDLNAETFDADEALEIGLVNSIMTNQSLQLTLLRNTK